MPTSPPTENAERLEAVDSAADVETAAGAPAEAPGLIALGPDAGPVCADGVCQL
ncbi:hypothetical protein [Streptomyces sp. 8K308]|uniref:hypothetical protein n=1 Tax=Streptomyces sp. 8K308 TaxID=2530388 RepID=UPI0014053273|nr:hypothetical protein [Streptomyces sp. 8K308]